MHSNYANGDIGGAHGMAMLAKWHSTNTPGAVYEIHRDGRRKDAGGKGVKWRCTCPHGKKHAKGQAQSPCHHLLAMYGVREIPKGALRHTAAGKRFKKTGRV